MARYTVDAEAVRAESRMVALQTAVALLRLIEAFREMFGSDVDRLMILLAVGAITAERPVKATDSPEHYVRFGVPIPSEDMTRCTALSIAAATGLPRETARRKTKQMIDDGVLRRDAHVGIRVNEQILQSPEFLALVQRHAGEIARLANALMERGVLVES
ncbi:hypothetical protein [Caulobacter sp. 17J80-11]|uniref:hypothetical protein n=1 Tax=Caulobacter sp. 17J80-11 TaxID=2763502 RepID=UPI001653B17F|nr:hypothetical protein [Caulobacter sp. 17J80-11]MBC6980362.1 hypothetical protein [Caulobacter sp. 17J80-11]